MKTALSGLLLLCLASTAFANEGTASLQWSSQIEPSQSVRLGGSAMPELSSRSVLVLDRVTGQVLLSRNATRQSPVASITKLMTAVLVLDGGQPLDEKIVITTEDRDTLKGTGSRLAIGTRYTRGELLHLALIASDNRAAHALARTFPGGLERFVAQMNRMAQILGMAQTVFVEPTGLSPGNRSTAVDLALLVDHIYQHYPEIRQISVSASFSLGVQRAAANFHNTNRLTRMDGWHIGLSKTGFINEAGHCLVMQAEVAQRDVVIVLLDADGTHSRAGDATRIRAWLEADPAMHRLSVPASPASRT